MLITASNRPSACLNDARLGQRRSAPLRLASALATSRLLAPLAVYSCSPGQHSCSFLFRLMVLKLVRRICRCDTELAIILGKYHQRQLAGSRLILAFIIHIWSSETDAAVNILNLVDFPFCFAIWVN